MKHEKNINGRYPLQDRPIYCFEIRNAALIRTDYQRYLVTDMGDGPARRRNWRIWTNTRTIYRTEDQMDRVLNNHYYTFDSNPEKAIAAFTRHLEARKAACLAETDRISKAMDDLKQAIAEYESKKGRKDPPCQS